MAEKKITLKKLSALINDPNTKQEDLAPYFRADEARSTPFSPVLEVNPETVDIGSGAEAGTRSAVLLNTANWLSKTDRQANFHHLMASGTYKGPVIVSEGDSWFQYPIRLKDTIDVLMRKYAILSLGGGGDTLDEMLRTAEYRRALESTGASILLLSGGGNDLVAGGNLARHLHPFDPTLSAEAYLKDSFNGVLERGLVNYDRIFRDVARRFPKVQIICHGYDYTVPTDGKWLGQPMKSIGIVDKALQKAISGIMVDRFNAKLGALAAQFSHVRALDLRGTVGDKRWYDELHPVNKGYSAVAAEFSKAIDEMSKPRTRGRTRGTSASGPKSISVHIGVNKADPAHYGNDLAPLEFCVADAEAMAEIASDRGFAKSIALHDEKATRKNVLKAIGDAAKTLKSGDIFFITYAGHGSQIKDFNRDEPGGPDEDWLDETLCLYDAQLIDDELYRMWAEFAEGVRIVGVFDCCHSGSVVRDSAARLSDASDDGTRPTAKRSVSLRASARIFKRNKAAYRAIIDDLAAGNSDVITRELDWPVRATVLQLSACQSNQLAEEDWSGNGLFTMRLIDTLNRADRFNGYEAFLDAIAARMPARQTPKFLRIGAHNPIFEAQSPFVI